ncbi:Uncharacterised protein [Flavonifractor plautii]|uniref:Uncharacterized protein n=1 Tax=Flavonifractor plautii TaxID=292800 RepID=A0A174M3M4_FLAPL|nr:Uncharacterised protein [Flavonifractor plautii]
MPETRPAVTALKISRVRIDTNSRTATGMSMMRPLGSMLA